MFRAAIVIALWAMAAFAQQPPLPQTQLPLTSDSSKVRFLPPGVYPGRSMQYMPPLDDVVIVFHTNERPLVVEITIMSNVVRRTRWWNNGAPATNDLVLSSNLASRTTNVVELRWDGREVK